MVDEFTTAQSETYRKELDDLKRDLANLRNDMGELVGTLTSMGKQSANVAWEKAQDQLNTRLRQLNDTYESMRAQSGRAAESVQQTIEERPVTSVLVALGVGFVLGKIMAMRRHD